LPPSARFRGLGQLAQVQLQTPRRSLCLLRSLHDYEPRANPAILQNWRALKEQTWYPDAWVTSLAACFSTMSNALYQMVAHLYTAQNPSVLDRHPLVPAGVRSVEDFEPALAVMQHENARGFIVLLGH